MVAPVVRRGGSTAVALQARRVRRDLSEMFVNVNDWRAWISHKGGWQNLGHKFQWFWFYFKKYGILGNLASCLHMREAWWESGEKRLVGMDALGHRYWETDEICRQSEFGFRFIDYPHHFHFAEWTKIPERWSGWTKMLSGRSPNQWEQIHRELGPEWRDYMVRSYGTVYGIAEEDQWSRTNYMDGPGNRGPMFSNPWHPDFQKIRRWYGQYGTRPHNRHTYSTRNAYDIDKYDPQDGARDYLEYEKGLSPDAVAQRETSRYKDHTTNPYNDLPFAQRINIHNNFTNKNDRYDGGKYGSQLYWEDKLDNVERAKSSRQYVSAFDDPSHSPANTIGHRDFGMESPYRNYHQVSDGRDSTRDYWREDTYKHGGASHGTAGSIRRV